MARPRKANSNTSERIAGTTDSGIVAKTRKFNPSKARLADKVAKEQEAIAMNNMRSREAGMMIDPAQHFNPIGTPTSFTYDAYRNSYANGLGYRVGTDIPMYFITMNQKNGGMIYFPTTLQEKFQWYRYFARCIYLNSNHLGEVLMSDGTLKSIKDVEIGDEVITALGTVKQVKDKFERRCIEDKAVDIKVWNLQNSLKTTHHHPYWILRKDNVRYDQGRHKKGIEFKPEWVNAEDVHVGDYVLMAPYKPAKFSDITTDQAKLLGYFAAEGSLIWEKRCIGTDVNNEGSGWKWNQEKIKVPVGIAFTLHSNERETLGKKILELAKSLFDLNGRIVHERGNSFEIVINGRKIAEFCNLHVGHGSLDKSLSREMLDATEESKRAFILSYAEGDGHQYDNSTTNNGKVLIATASDSLASQVQMMAISAGIMCRIAKYERKETREAFKNSHPIWHISIPSHSADELMGESTKWEASESVGDRRGAFFINGYAAHMVKSITFTQEDDTVYNIEVDAEGDEKSYICNGMVTHNTDAYVGRAMDLLTDLPMSKMSLNMPKCVPEEKREEIRNFFRHQMETLNVFQLCRDVLYETNLIGNCFPEDHLVHLADGGMTPIVNIREGDRVLMANGEGGVVSNTMRRSVSEWLIDFDIEKLSGLDFTPTSEHPVLVFRDGEEKMVIAKEVRIGDYVGISFSNKTEDVCKKSIKEEVVPILKARYDSVLAGDNDLGGYDIAVSYTTPSGCCNKTADIKDKILDFMAQLKEPVKMKCEDVAEIIGISNVKKMRNVAYLMSRRGIIHTERRGTGTHGSIIEWYPLENRKNVSDLYGRVFEKKFSSEIEAVSIDENFLYLLGYWLGDGWLWEYKRPTSYPFICFDICAEKGIAQCSRLVEKIEASD